jgi:uncharacterized protein
MNQTFRNKKLSLYYWKEGNDKVDFIVEYQKKVIGLEVKSGLTGKLTGMNAFKDKFAPDKLFVIGKDGIPWQEFLALDMTDLF